MKTYFRKNILLMAIFSVLFGCGDKCEYKYWEGVEIQLKTKYSMNEINGFVVSEKMDTVILNNNNPMKIYLTNPRDTLVSIAFSRPNETLVNAKVFIFSPTNSIILTDFSKQEFYCKPNIKTSEKKYVEFTSLKVNGSEVLLDKNKQSQYRTVTIQL